MLLRDDAAGDATDNGVFCKCNACSDEVTGTKLGLVYLYGVVPCDLTRVYFLKLTAIVWCLFSPSEASRSGASIIYHGSCGHRPSSPGRNMGTRRCRFYFLLLTL